MANTVLVVDAASADEFRTTVLAQRFVVFRTSVLEGRATQQRRYRLKSKEVLANNKVQR